MDIDHIDPAETSKVAATLVGRTEDIARAITQQAKLKLRVTRRDKDRFMGTCDYRQDRINAQVDKGVITHVSVG